MVSARFIGLAIHQYTVTRVSSTTDKLHAVEIDPNWITKICTLYNIREHSDTANDVELN